jgi:pre-rRNA-processing protein TSR3
MKKFGYARPISRGQIPAESAVLNPAATDFIIPSDKDRVSRYGLVVVDCSWNLASGVFNYGFRGVQKKLPLLLAGNPTNYSKLSRLSSVEAVAATLFIIGMAEHSKKLLSLYKWGETFLTLNANLLVDYSECQTVDEIRKVERDYFPNITGNDFPSTI